MKRIARIICGDVRDTLRSLPDASVQCCVTSPPYWGLRDYGHAKQLGAERTYVEYVENMVAVFREVRRVLADDGVLWLNLGDCYATGAGSVGECPGGGAQGERWRGGHEGKHGKVGPMTQANRLPQPGLKPKDLVGAPWRVAFALQADGWWLRADCIWSKPNPMPESTKDRPTKAHEYVFLLSKSGRYFYDAKAIEEPAVCIEARSWTDANEKQRGHSRRHAGFSGRYAERVREQGVPTTRNRRSVWTIATQPFDGAHFAVMPEALVQPCILAGSREGDTVLDPFAGSGTVGVVSLRRGRSFIGCELNPEYAAMARARILSDAPLLNAVEAA